MRSCNGGSGMRHATYIHTGTAESRTSSADRHNPVRKNTLKLDALDLPQ